MESTFERKLLVTLMVPVIGVALAMPAYAQTAQEREQSSAQRMPDGSRSAAPPAQERRSAEDKGMTARGQGQERIGDTASREAENPAEAFRDMRISRLRGMEVTNAEGERLGSVEDVVLDLNKQQVQYVVLSHGGLLGFGDKRFMFPVKAFEPGQEADELVLKVSKEQLASAPGMEKGKWDDPAYRERVDQHFGGELAANADPEAKLVSASGLVGKEVHNRTGQSIGDVEDIVVSLETGKVHYVAMDLDDSDKLVPIALKDLAVMARQVDELVLNTDMSQIDMDSAFDEGTWPKGEYPRYQAGADQSAETGTGRAGLQEGVGAGASSAAGGSRAGGEAQSRPGTSQESAPMPGNSEAARGGQTGQPGSANR